MREKFWELSGSKMGNAMKIEKRRDDDPDKHLLNEDGEFNFKASSRYHTALARAS